MGKVPVRQHVRRHVQLPVKGAVPLHWTKELPESGFNELGVEFKTMTLDDFGRLYAGRVGSKRRKQFNALFEYLIQHRDAGINIREFAVYGSFTSDKPEPGDIDVAILRSPGGDLSKVWNYQEALREHNLDTFSVVNRSHYNGWLAAAPRPGQSKVVVRVKP